MYRYIRRLIFFLRKNLYQFWSKYLEDYLNFVLISIIFFLPFPIFFPEGLTYQCDAGWSGFEDHCYFFSKGKRTWQEARAVCEQEGADLATIQNQGENDFIFQELPSGRCSVSVALMTDECSQ